MRLSNGSPSCAHRWTPQLSNKVTSFKERRIPTWILFFRILDMDFIFLPRKNPGGDFWQKVAVITPHIIERRKLCNVIMHTVHSHRIRWIIMENRRLWPVMVKVTVPRTTRAGTVTVGDTIQTNSQRLKPCNKGFSFSLQIADITLHIMKPLLKGLSWTRMKKLHSSKQSFLRQ